MYREPSLTFLKYTIAFLLLGSAAVLIAIFIFVPDQTLRSLGAGSTFLLALVAWFLLARGRIETTVYLLAIGMWSIVSGVALFTGGLRSTVNLLYPQIVLLLGWFIGIRAALAGALLTIATALGFALAESWELLPLPFPTPPAIRWIIQGFVLASSVVMIFYFMRSYQNRINALNELESDLNRAQAVAHVGSWVYVLAADKMQLSAETCRIFGVPEQTTGSRDFFLTLVHSDDRDTWDGAWQQALKTGEPIETEHRAMVGGSMRWIRQRVKLESNANGAPVRVVGTTQDITERKQADEALRESENRMSAVFHGNPIGTSVIKAADGVFVDINGVALRMLAYRRDEVIGRTSVDLQIFVHPSEREEGLRRLREHGCLDQFPIEYRKKTGETSVMEYSGRIVDVRGEQCIVGMWVDMTERKKADAALNISEERLRLAMDATQQGWFDLNIPTGEVVVSPSFARMVGGDPRQFFINREIWVDSIHREDRDAVLQAYEKCLRSGEAQHMEYRMITKSGEWKWLHSAGKVVATDAAGLPLRMTGTHADITERKRADQRIRESEDRYRALVEQSPIGIFVHHDGKFLYLNPTATSLFGATSARELIGKPILRIVHPDFREIAQKRIENARAGQFNPMTEQKLIRLDGTSFDVEIQGTPTQYEGTPAIQVSFMDISVRKRLENNADRERMRLETILKMASDGIHVVDGDGLLVEANAAFLNMLGYDKSAIGKLRVTDWSGLESWEVIKARNDELIARRGQALFEVPIRRRDGVILIAEINSAGIEIDGKGYLYAAFRDITERKQAEAKHGQLEEQLREAQKMEAIGTLAGGIAHDFNNIIAAILGNVELAREDAIANPVALESLEEIHKAGSRARELVRQILAFSRREPTQRQPIALAPVVDEAAHLLRATLPARVSIEAYCDAGVPRVEADHTQIQQILVNLATNAMQAMHGNPGHIVMRLDAVMLDAALAGVDPELGRLNHEHPGRTVRLVVNDDGPGMEAAILERIFEPFFTTKPVGEGTGLGLSVVHGIVKAHEGAIVVESAPGKGTTFTIYLPVASGEHAQTDTPGSEEDKVTAAAAPASAPALNLDGGQHILYLDDDESLVFLVKRLLERRGYRVSGYINQSEALAALRADPAAFDLLLTDYNMPGMSGLDVAREVSAIRADLPVAIASGFIDETLRAEAGSAGVRELIFKADAAEEFCAVVQRLAQKIGNSQAAQP